MAHIKPISHFDEMNYDILKNARKSLKETGSKLIVTTLNGLFPLYHSVKEFSDSHNVDSDIKRSESTFDLMTFRDCHVAKVIDDCGIENEYNCNERYYIPSEITWLLKCLGFSKIDIFGAKL